MKTNHLDYYMLVAMQGSSYAKGLVDNTIHYTRLLYGINTKHHMYFCVPTLSRTSLEVSKTLMISVNMHLLGSSKEMEPLL